MLDQEKNIPLEILSVFAKSFIHKRSKSWWEQNLTTKYLHVLKDIDAFHADLDRRVCQSVDHFYGVVSPETKGWCYDFKSIPKQKPFSWAFERGDEEDLLFITDPQKQAFYFYHGEDYILCERS